MNIKNHGVITTSNYLEQMAKTERNHRNMEDEMRQIDYSILYRRGKDLVLFDFNAEEHTEDLRGLIIFHFEERHDFQERIETCAITIFKNFYSNTADNDIELIDWSEKNM